MKVYEVTSIIVVNEDSETPDPMNWDIEAIFEDCLDVVLHAYVIKDLDAKYLNLHQE